MSSHISREKRESAILLYNQGYSYRQIGEKLGIAPSTVWYWFRKFAAEKSICNEKEVFSTI